MTRTLPERPDLAQLRRQAKELHRAAAAGGAGALGRIEAVSSRVTLSAAQLAIAREYGFASWPRLKAELDRRHCLDVGDVERLAGLVADDPGWARRGVHSCLSRPDGSVLGYLGVARFHGHANHGRVADLARVLLAAGASPDGEPGDTEPPLITAASYGEAALAQALIDAGADVEATGTAVPGGTALGHAINFGMVDVVDVLAHAGAVIHDLAEAAGVGDLAGHQIEAAGESDRARALQAAALCERLSVIDRLVEAGTPVDAEVDGATALHAAAGGGKARSVARLLEHGADANRRDANFEATALGWCRHHRSGWGPAPGARAVERLLAPLTIGDWVHDEILVHRAEPDDEPAAQAVLEASGAGRHQRGADDRPDAQPARPSGSAGRRQDGPVWVAEQGGTVIGTVAAVPDGATLHLVDLVVVPPARRRGVGRLLITRLTEWAFPTGYDHLDARWPATSDAALRLLARHGFATVRATDGDTSTVTMQQDLAAIRSLIREAK